MYLKNKLLIVLLFSITNIFSQKQIAPGYYIDNNDNKIMFTIKYWELAKTPHFFDIIETVSKTSKKITSNDAKIVVIDNKAKYVRGTVEIDRHSASVNFLEYNATIIKKQESHFFNCIVEGPNCLLSFEDNDIEHFFYSNDLYKTINQLDYKQYLSQKNESVILENGEFINQLLQLNNCQNDTKINSLIEKCTYKLEDLSKVFESLNDCVGTTKNELKIQEKSKGKFFVKGIVTVNQLELAGAKDLKFEKDNYLGLGAELEYALPYYNNLFSILLNVDYINYKNIGTISSPLYNDYFISVGALTDPSKNKVTATYFSLNSTIGIAANLLKFKGFQTSIFTTFSLISTDKLNLIFENGATFDDVPYGIKHSSSGISFRYRKIELSYRFHNGIYERNFGFGRQALLFKYIIN